MTVKLRCFFGPGESDDRPPFCTYVAVASRAFALPGSSLHSSTSVFPLSVFESLDFTPSVTLGITPVKQGPTKNMSFEQSMQRCYKLRLSYVSFTMRMNNTSQVSKIIDE